MQSSRACSSRVQLMEGVHGERRPCRRRTAAERRRATGGGGRHCARCYTLGGSHRACMLRGITRRCSGRPVGGRHSRDEPAGGRCNVNSDGMRETSGTKVRGWTTCSVNEPATCSARSALLSGDARQGGAAPTARLLHAGVENTSTRFTADREVNVLTPRRVHSQGGLTATGRSGAPRRRSHSFTPRLSRRCAARPEEDEMGEQGSHRKRGDQQAPPGLQPPPRCRQQDRRAQRQRRRRQRKQRSPGRRASRASARPRRRRQSGRSAGPWAAAGRHGQGCRVP